ncbi:oxidoreductase, short chain dehydrogenase/reductase family [Nocardioidaceae bacterium Broad-1]|uniref:SDR family oxidoreductase n=1 Tax=Nocardioides luteus TaxID=1844 RepID=UPI0002028567|nr:SDR family oxidoreductase [Nocardioides luteus]EGD40036.1 oxidoreductase, short chain dehydrogenase/reductase family [Nocardioidaceae bacterium Broad-1]MBG6098796.1 NAD(P)-dependent dehydrogenase (short-subunit alcohol dehydrogenase family) [Nocardioides luteus]
MTISTSSRIVLIGATSGIGLAIARRAAESGAAVTIASRRPESIERALGQLPAGVVGRAVDASSSHAVAGFFDEIGEFDHFAYTAAENLTGFPMADYTVESAQQFFALRLFHMLDAVRLAVPHLTAHGSITLMSGTAAFKGGPGWTLGTAVSGAVVSAARSLAVELAPLRVNVVAPGVVRSPLWSQMSEEDREGMYASLSASLPLKRVGEPDDVAKAFLALMDQDYVTGTVSVVDGGTLIS